MKVTVKVTNSSSAATCSILVMKAVPVYTASPVVGVALPNLIPTIERCVKALYNSGKPTLVGVPVSGSTKKPSPSIELSNLTPGTNSLPHLAEPSNSVNVLVIVFEVRHTTVV